MTQTSDGLIKRIAPLFEENFAQFGELGAAISIWQNGKPMLDLHGGFRDANREKPWTADTLVLIWSATKGLGSACLLHVLQEHAITIEHASPSSGRNSRKAEKRKSPSRNCFPIRPVCARSTTKLMYSTTPPSFARSKNRSRSGRPGTAHGYHARTFGFLLDELVRRIAGTTLGEYWRKIFAEPSISISGSVCRNEQNERVATIYAAKAGGDAKPAQFYRDLATPGTLVRERLSLPRRIALGQRNELAGKRAHCRSFPSAESETQHRWQSFTPCWQMAASSTAGDFSHAETIALDDDDPRLWHGSRLSNSDGVFCRLHERSAGSSARIFGPSSLAFGHPGAGGSHAFADPENNLSFAYVMNQMEQSLLPNEKSLRLVDAIYRQTYLRASCTNVRRDGPSAPYRSPITVTAMFRRCDARRCSNRKIPCHVPSCISPSAIGMTSLERVNTMRICEVLSSAPSSSCS